MLYIYWTCDEIDIIYYYIMNMCNPYCVFFKNELILRKTKTKTFVLTLSLSRSQSIFTVRDHDTIFYNEKKKKQNK